jgi:hypothetical protein
MSRIGCLKYPSVGIEAAFAERDGERLIALWRVV